MAGAIIVSGNVPFGAMSNQLVVNLNVVNEQINRLQAAAAAAQSGMPAPAAAALEGGNFGVVADATPGDKGAAYAFALGTLNTAWQTFWTAALASITALDNGGQA